MYKDILQNDAKIINHFYVRRYIKIVDSILENKKAHVKKETHHILPKSIFPEYSNLKIHKFNKLTVSPREHYILHWILSKAYGGKMVFAFNYMSRMTIEGRDYKISSKAYDYIKKNMKHSEETKERMRQTALRRWETDEDFKSKEIQRRNSEEYRQQISKHFSDYWKSKPKKPKKHKEPKSFKGELNPFYGRVHTEETRRKISQSNTGRKHSSEAKEKMSQAGKGKKKPKGFSEKLSEIRTGVPLSQESKNKISQLAKERCKDDEYLRKMSIAQKNRKRGKCIHCDIEMDICNLKKYHNDKCKKKPN